MGCDGVFGGQAVSGPHPGFRLGGKCPPLPSWGTRLFVQLGGEGRSGRGWDWGLQEDQFPALPGLPKQGVYPQVLAAQPATSVLTQAHRTQHSHCCKTTHTFKSRYTRVDPVPEYPSDTITDYMYLPGTNVIHYFNSYMLRSITLTSVKVK